MYIRLALSSCQPFLYLKLYRSKLRWHLSDCSGINSFSADNKRGEYAKIYSEITKNRASSAY
ncbi:hypothetical protein VA7868_00783 [Vibrio aerogenes CECT 7868]|uniref:Uncharacterized protein n=1 Tax=Vibrio aerogenes CECT 7868 TaxID=1216006 RepID=A0A1M5WLL9_9VIBR|nr:hypothetical protein VA7868_00783 [Vibrio aerogenes CECT 7868]